MTVAQTNKERVNFIDRFYVPSNSEKEFIERMRFNRAFIKSLPGFIKDTVYKSTDENRNFIFVTIAVWENEIVMKQANELVQAEYIKTGFNSAEFFERLDLKIERRFLKNC